MNNAHIQQQLLLIGVNFYGDLHLDVNISICTESEKFLKCSRIGNTPCLYKVLSYLVVIIDK